ncbi:hypothetical protein J7J18_03585 [bacterium]|nr:hypothetical protein [bacterium]
MSEMCLSAYDLICDECREKWDILTKAFEMGIIDIDELKMKQFACVCKDCRRVLIEEGFFNPCSLSVGEDCRNESCPFYEGAAGCGVIIHLEELKEMWRKRNEV